MSISELNHFMTYVVDGWLLFSTGFISIGFVSFVSRRIQEDIEADAVALAQQMEAAVAEAETVSTGTAVQQSITEAPTASPTKPTSSPQPPTTTEPEAPDDDTSDVLDEEAIEAARLEEVAAISEQLAKTKGKQSDTSSVSVST